MFESFRRRRIPTGEAEIDTVVKGSGPPILLIHGYPQTKAIWHKVAPALAERSTVVAIDLRGYGASSRPPAGDDHAGYSKRRMAGDLIAVMGSLGFDRFSVAGHDRGGRVAYRMALDHPERYPLVSGPQSNKRLKLAPAAVKERPAAYGADRKGRRLLG